MGTRSSPPEIKKKILGENLVRLHGIAVEAKKAEIAKMISPGDGLVSPWSTRG